MIPQLVIGGIFAGLSLIDSLAKGINQNVRQHEALKEKERQRDAALDMLELSYNQGRKQAIDNARNINKDATFGELMLGTGINGALNKIGLGQEARTLAYNEASINSGSQAGAANQQLATSGTKGSSAAQAVEMQQIINEQKLQHQEDIDRKQDEINLESAMNTMLQESYNIQKQRTAASDLLKSYQEGGNAYEMYVAKRKDIREGMNYSVGALENEFGMGIYNTTMNSLTNPLNAFSTGVNFYDTNKELFDYL